VAVGLNCMWVLLLFKSVDPVTFLAIIPASALASLLPDINAGAAKIHFIGKGVLRGFVNSGQGKYFSHRGIMHSLFVVALFHIFLLIVTGGNKPFSIVVTLAYLSHPIIDGFNAGVGYLNPFYLKRFALIPRRYRVSVDSKADRILCVLACIGAATFLLLVTPIVLQMR